MTSYLFTREISLSALAHSAVSYLYFKIQRNTTVHANRTLNKKKQKINNSMLYKISANGECVWVKSPNN